MQQAKKQMVKYHISIKTESGKILYYTADKLIRLDKTQISFIDRFGKNYVFSADMILRVNPISEGDR